MGEDSPGWSVTAVPRKPTVNQGDEIEIEIYLTGSGIPDRSKLYCNFAGIELDPKEPAEVVRCIQVGEDKNGDPAVGAGSNFTTTNEFGEPYQDSIVYGLNLGFFLDAEDPDSGSAIPPVISEVKHGALPPLLLRLPSSDNAGTGTSVLNQFCRMMTESV